MRPNPRFSRLFPSLKYLTAKCIRFRRKGPVDCVGASVGMATIGSEVGKPATAPSPDVLIQYKFDWLSDYTSLYRAQLFTDCRLVTPSGTFDLHRLVLAAASPFLGKAMEAIDDDVISILMPEFTVEEISGLVSLMYGEPDDEGEEALHPVSRDVITHLLIDPIGSDPAKFGMPETAAFVKDLNRKRKAEADEAETAEKIRKTVMLAKTSGKSKKCFLCPVHRQTETELLDHVKDDHGQDFFETALDVVAETKLRSYRCCDNTFFDKSKWTQHKLSVHAQILLSQKQNLSCEYCDDQFVFTFELQDQTYKNPSGISEYRCPLGCQTKSSSKDVLNRHVDSQCSMVQRLLCPYCGGQMAARDRKSKATHRKRPPPNPTGKTARKRSNNCHLCPESFPRFETLELHLQKAHAIRSIYGCPSCDRVYSSLKKLTQHQNVHEKKFECEECGKCFDTPSARKMHALCHNPDSKSHACDYCGKKFVNNYRKQDHMNIHTGKKPHQCPFCDYRCHIQTSLTHHKKICKKRNTEEPQIVQLGGGVEIVVKEVGEEGE